MNCPRCNEAFDSICPCGYAPPSAGIGIPVFRSTYRDYEPGISREEFGRALYDTIFTIGGLLGLEQQRAAAIHAGHGDKIAGLLSRRATLQHTVAQQLPQLNDDEMARLLVEYPWVVRV